MSTTDFDTFLTLDEALKAAGWAIYKFEIIGGGVTLTIVPQMPETGEAE
jgi:hypothetical protein